MTFPILTSEDVIAGRWQVLRRIDSGGAAAVYAVNPLREFIQAGMLTLVQSLDLYRQVLHAVAYLHRNEVIHRDIKPGNILVDDGLHVTLIDLGACRSPLREEITIEADCTGTPSYMSPEQAAICVGVKDPLVRKFADSRQADIYALGLLLYHLLSGQWPHGRPGRSPAELANFYRRRATERPEAAEFPDEALGQLAMAMLLPAHQGRPSDLSGVITTFEAAFAAMRPVRPADWWLRFWSCRCPFSGGQIA